MAAAAAGNAAVAAAACRQAQQSAAENLGSPGLGDLPSSPPSPPSAQAGVGALTPAPPSGTLLHSPLHAARAPSPAHSPRPSKVSRVDPEVPVPVPVPGPGPGPAESMDRGGRAASGVRAASENAAPDDAAARDAEGGDDAAAAAGNAAAAAAAAAADEEGLPTAANYMNVLTLKQNMIVAYYVSCAVKSNKGNKGAVAGALRSIVPHLFNESHESCGKWCRARNDPTYKPTRLGRKWWDREHYKKVPPQVMKEWRDAVKMVIDENFLAPAKLEEIYRGVSSSPLESFNNTVSAIASKRVFLGRAHTYHLLVDAAILNWMIGPSWIEKALRKLGVEAGEVTRRQLARWSKKKDHQHDTRQTAEYRLKRARQKTKSRGGQWEDSPDLRYVGGSLEVGAGGYTQENLNPDDGEAQKPDAPESETSEDEEMDPGDVSITMEVGEGGCT